MVYPPFTLLSWQWLQICCSCFGCHEKCDSADQWTQATSGEYWQDCTMAGLCPRLGGRTFINKGVGRSQLLVEKLVILANKKKLEGRSPIEPKAKVPDKEGLFRVISEVWGNHCDFILFIWPYYFYLFILIYCDILRKTVFISDCFLETTGLIKYHSNALFVLDLRSWTSQIDK